MGGFGLILIGVLIGALITFFVTRSYYIKDSKKCRDEVERLTKENFDLNSVISILNRKSSENKED